MFQALRIVRVPCFWNRRNGVGGDDNAAVGGDTNATVGGDDNAAVADKEDTKMDDTVGEVQ